MNALIVYDSAYGNTREVALAMQEAIGEGARALAVADVTAGDLAGLDLLLVGSPTQGGRPTAPVKALLDAVPADGLQSVRAAAFDTRVASGEVNLPLRLLMKVIGYAAPRISGALEKAGAQVVAPPEGFVVDGKEGPLRAGERERAARWAAGLAGSSSDGAGA